MSSSLLHGLADPTRWRIVEMLSAGGMPVSAIASRFPMTRPAVSKHLRVLRLAGLVVERKEGRHRIYELVAEPLEEVAARFEMLASGAGVLRGRVAPIELSGRGEGQEAVQEQPEAEAVVPAPAGEEPEDDDRWRSW